MRRSGTQLELGRSRLQRATLPQLLERAVPYERWRAPFDPRLQRLAWLAGAALLAHLLFLILLPSPPLTGSSGFFLVLHGALRGLLLWISAHAPLLLALNLVSLLAYLWLVWRTRGLRAGRLEWHWAALGEVAAGAAGAFPLAASLAIILINLIIWILIITAAVWFAILILGAILEG